MSVRSVSLLWAAVLLLARPLGAAEEPKASAPRVSAKLSTNDPANLFFADDFTSGKTPITISVEMTNLSAAPLKLSNHWTLRDHTGQRLRDQSMKRTELAGSATDKWFVTFRPGADISRQGWFRFTLKTAGDKQDSEWSLSFAILPRPAAGTREGSRFGLSVTNPDARAFEVMRRLGARWLRTDSGCSWSSFEPQKKGEYVWDAFDKLVADCKAHDLLLLPSLAYAPDWAAQRSTDGQAFQKRDAPEKAEDYADAVKAAVTRYSKDVRCFEAWNDPQVMGWTWHASAQQYRDLLKAAHAALKGASADSSLVASASSASHLRDVVFAQGVSAAESVDQTSFHTFSTTAPEEELLCQAEFAALLSKAAGKTQVRDTEAAWQLWDSPKLTDYVPRAYAVSALAGLRTLCWSTLADQDTGLFDSSFQPRPAAAAYAVCAQMLDGAALVEDLYPYSHTLWGALLKNTEGRKVAVLWTTGDRGSLELTTPGDVQVYDIMGNPTGQRRGKSVTVPLGPEVTYVVSTGDQLQLLTALRQAKTREVAPVTARALPFTTEIGSTPAIQVLVTNESNRPFSGDMSVKAPAGWKLMTPRQRFGPILPGASMSVPFLTTTAITSTDNQYPVSFSILPLDRGWFSTPWKYEKSQILSVAAATKGTPTIDGDLSDWKEALPQRMNRKEFLSPFTPEALQKAWTPGNLSATFYTRWDADNFYFAAEVQDNNHSQASFADNPYALPFDGDTIQLAFGSDLEEGRLKPADAPNARRGLLFDTDYELAMSLTPKGPELLLLKTPQTHHQSYLPTNPEIGLGLVPDAKLAVKRDDLKETTVYECAIPWSLLKGVDRKKLRLDVLINDRDKEERGAAMEWSAGLGESQGNTLTFSPSWRYHLANQAPWTFLGGGQ
ncbi:MAG TPA: hypothetical protein VGN26_14210 [Armatimonadota bacterium]